MIDDYQSMIQGVNPSSHLDHHRPHRTRYKIHSIAGNEFKGGRTFTFYSMTENMRIWPQGHHRFNSLESGGIRTADPMQPSISPMKKPRSSGGVQF